MLKKIFQELVLIRIELKAIRCELQCRRNINGRDIAKEIKEKGVNFSRDSSNHDIP